MSRARVGLGLAVALAFVACGGEDPRVSTAPRDPDGGRVRIEPAPDPTPDAGSEDAGPPPDAGPTPDASPPPDATPQEPDANTPAATCGTVNCGANGDCVEDETGRPSCVCDRGYVVDESATDGLCVEDRSCVELRLLECRTEFGSSGSAVGMPLSVSYCSGNPVTNLGVENLTLEEDGGEGFEPIVPSTESSFTIVDRTFTNYIYLVVDISGSILDSDVLDDIATGIGTFLDGLAGLDDSFRIAVYAFDGKPYLYRVVPETASVAYVRSQLGILPNAQGLDPGSTNLYGATIYSLNAIERSRALRHLQSRRGDLATKTVILISDGDDEAGVQTFMQARNAIDDTVTNVITVGLGAEVNYPRLTELGRDGSFSAPTPALINQAFTDIAMRFQQYARSLYFFGYCSPKRTGVATARIGIQGLDVNQSCRFSAAGFGAGCGPDLFNPAVACTDQTCGGIIGCGTCAEDGCCAAQGGRFQCVAPSHLPADAACGVEAQCEPGLTCAADPNRPRICHATVALTAECAPERCNPEDGYCVPQDEADPGPRTCAAGLIEGAQCEAPNRCLSGNCSRLIDEPLSSTRYCHPPARMFESCAGGACEPGTWCDTNGGNVCRPQRFNGDNCSSSIQCLYGYCENIQPNFSICAQSPLAPAAEPPVTTRVGSYCYFPLPDDLHDPAP